MQEEADPPFSSRAADGTTRDAPAYYQRMGVFHMAIPFPAALPVRPMPIDNTPAPRPAKPVSTPLPGTLLPQQRTPEARVQRTPEQQAEQDALTLLVRQCLAGDQGAWNRMVSGQHKRVYAICYRFTGDPTEAEDITQDVFLKVYRNLSSFDPSKGGFQTWITTLTRNLLVDNYRRTRIDRASDSLDETLSGEEDGPTQAERLQDPGQNQEQRFAGLELKATIQAALLKLSPELREAVILRDLEDMDYKEIAVILKIPEGTVKSRISRGRAELGRLLQRIEGQVV
jgi:RNA polymerase sigma-70 factor (ECF subfamily)